MDSFWRHKRNIVVNIYISGIKVLFFIDINQL